MERWPGPDKRRLRDLPHISSGQLACTLGHLSIAEALIESGDAAWLVLEDDVVFCRNFAEHWNGTLLDLPDDWDFLCLGATYLNGRTPVAPRINLLHSAYGLHAYLLTPQGAHIWLRAWLRTPRRIADHYTMDLMRSGEARIYGLLPYWAVQRREADSLLEGVNRADDYAARFGGWFEDDRPVSDPEITGEVLPKTVKTIPRPSRKEPRLPSTSNHEPVSSLLR